MTILLLTGVWMFGAVVLQNVYRRKGPESLNQKILFEDYCLK